MGLFSKEAKCGKCEKLVSKKELANYDSTHQGINPEGKDIKVCNDCLMEMFFEDILSFNESLVFVSPMQTQGYVTYHFGRLEEKIKPKVQWEQNLELVKGFTALLPATGTKCSDCEKPAKHTWCGTEALNDDPYTWKVNKNTSYQHLCANCLVKKFKHTLSEKNIRLTAVYPPIKGDGFLCSWEI